MSRLHALQQRTQHGITIIPEELFELAWAYYRPFNDIEGMHHLFVYLRQQIQKGYPCLD